MFVRLFTFILACAAIFLCKNTRRSSIEKQITDKRHLAEVPKKIYFWLESTWKIQNSLIEDHFQQMTVDQFQAQVCLIRKALRKIKSDQFLLFFEKKTIFFSRNFSCVGFRNVMAENAFFKWKFGCWKSKNEAKFIFFIILYFLINRPQILYKQKAKTWLHFCLSEKLHCDILLQNG